MEAERETYQSALGKKHKTNTLPEIHSSKQAIASYLYNALTLIFYAVDFLCKSFNSKYRYL